jgi:hypothetical protein
VKMRGRNFMAICTRALCGGDTGGGNITLVQGL